MPIIKSAIKRVKISEKQLKRNSAYKSRVKTFIKKFENALNTESKDVVEQHYRQCISVLDKAAQKGILAKNTVARKKSLLAKKLKNQALSTQNETNKEPQKK